MRRFSLVLILLFPTLTFGQTFTGNYRAIFFNLFSEPKTIIAEFEVKTDNSISARVKIGDEVKLFHGSVDKKGKFEAVSQAEGNIVYKLKGKFDQDHKISFVQRTEQRSPGTKSVLENGLAGTFAKVIITPEPVKDPANSEKDEPRTDNETELVDNGQSQVEIQFSLPVSKSEWKGFIGRVAFVDSKEGKRLELTAGEMINQKKISLRILTKPDLSEQKLWKTTELQIAAYREELENPVVRHTFLTAEHIYQSNSLLQDGTLEIIKETDTQLVFKLKRFRIKRLTKEDFVELNGFIYADK